MHEVIPPPEAPLSPIECGGVVLLARGSGWRRMAGSQTWRGFRGV